MKQQNLFLDDPYQAINRQERAKRMHFDGETYEPSRDQVRLTGQQRLVFELMRDGQWRRLADIVVNLRDAYSVYASEAGISARLRDLRKARFGSHTVERSNIGGGTFQYRLIVREA